MRKFLITTVLTMALMGMVQAQVLQVKVSIQAGHLSNDEQDELMGFAEKIEQYYNGYEWLEDEFEYDVPTNIQVIIETVQKKTHEKIYKAQFLISTSSGENFYDRSWEFPYEQSYPLSHFKGQFDPLTHFLDFYAYMVLAGELDTNGLLLGSPLYEKAQDIANQGLMSQYPRGWSQRMDDLQKITHIRTRPLREVKPDFFEALYLLNEDKPLQAYEFAKKTLKGIAKVYNVQPNNRYLQMFFNAHYNDLARLFRGRNLELNQLVEYDSKHREAYRAMMD